MHMYGISKEWYKTVESGFHLLLCSHNNYQLSACRVCRAGNLHTLLRTILSKYNL